MEGVEPGRPLTWDGRGGVRPERVARRRQLATWAAVLALAVAVPAVIGSSAGWWSGGGEVGAGSGGAGAAETGAVPGGVDGGGGGSAIVGPLAESVADGGGGGGRADVGEGAGGGVDLVVGLDGGLLDAGLDPGSGCGVGPAGDPVRIGVVVDGRQEESEGPVVEGAGEPLEVAAARHLVALANCAGGVLDRPVEVVVAEAAGSALASSDAVAELVRQEVSVIIGPPSVDVALPVAEAAGPVAVVVPWSIEPALDDHDRGVFLIDPDVTVLADAAARLILDRGWRRAVLFTDSSPLDDLAAVAFTGSLAAGGGERAVELPLVAGDGGVIDLDDQLDRLGVGALSSSAPDVVVTTAGADQAAQLLAALGRAGVEVPVVALDRREPRLGRQAAVAGMEIVGRPLAAAGGRSSRLASALETAGSDDAGSDDAGAPADPLGPSVDPVAAARVADAILVALDAVARAATSDPGEVADEVRSGGLIDGIAGPTGVWHGRNTGPDAVLIPVLGSGPEGAVLTASLEPVSAGG